MMNESENIKINTLLEITTWNDFEGKKLFRVVNTDYIYSYNYENNSIESFMKIRDDFNICNIYFDSKIIGEMMYFLPYMSNKMYVCDLRTKQTSHIIIGNSKDNNRFNTFKQMATLNNKVFLIGDSNVIKVVDLNDSSVNELRIPDIPYLYRDLCRVGDKVFFPVIDQHGDRRSILEVDLFEEKTIKHSNVTTDMNIGTLCFDGNSFWVSGNRKKIIKLNTRFEIIEEIDISDKKAGELGVFNNYFSSAFVLGSDIIFSPLHANSALKLNTESLDLRNIFSIDENNCIWKILKVYDDLMYFQVSRLEDNRLMSDFIINSDGKIVKKDVIRGAIPCEWLYENESMSLENYIGEIRDYHE